MQRAEREGGYLFSRWRCQSRRPICERGEVCDAAESLVKRTSTAEIVDGPTTRLTLRPRLQHRRMLPIAQPTLTAEAGCEARTAALAQNEYSLSVYETKSEIYLSAGFGVRVVIDGLVLATPSAAPN